jgi:hypothetical protein
MPATQQSPRHVHSHSTHSRNSYLHVSPPADSNSCRQNARTAGSFTSCATVTVLSKK